MDIIILCKLLLLTVNKKSVPKSSHNLWETFFLKHTVTCMLDVREKIWRLKYTSLKEFVEDIFSITRLAKAISGSSNSFLSETADSIPVILDAEMNSMNSSFEKYNNVVLVHSDSISSTCNDDSDMNDTAFSKKNFFYHSFLFPSIFSKGIRIDDFSDSVSMLRSKEWEKTYMPDFINFSDINEISNSTNEAKKNNNPLSLLLKAVGIFDSHLPPSRDELLHILDQHSLMLRSSLRSTGVLRDSIQKLFFRYDSGFQDPMDSNVITLGEMRVAAEYKIANRNLKQRMKQLKAMYFLEKEARIRLQGELNKLQKVSED